MSLRDGLVKMSKSADSDMTRVNLTDNADMIVKKIKKAKMDAEPMLPACAADFEGRPEAKNLYMLYSALADVPMQAVFDEWGGRAEANGAFKQALADVAVAHLAPITTRMNQLMGDVSAIDAILRAGTEKANAIAETTVRDVREVMGFWQ